MSRDREEVARHLGRAARATASTPLPLALAVLLIALAAIAEEGPDSDPTVPPALGIARDYDAALARGAALAPQEIRDRLEEAIREHRPEAAGFAEEARRIFEDQVDAERIRLEKSEAGYKARFVAFVSTAMPDGAIRSATELALARGDMDIVYRGVLPGQNLGEFVRGLAKAEGGEVRASIDPRLFREHEVEVAPAVLDAGTGKIVFGTVNPAMLDEADDRAFVGETWALAEMDLIAAIRQGVRETDWQKKAEAALRDFWSHAPMIPLAHATEAAERRIDARFRLARDFALPDGTVLYRAGELIDPTIDHPFTLTLIVFNGFRDEELDLVKREMRRAAEPVLMVTELPADRGWERLVEIEAALGAPVYLMPEEVRTRFRIEKTVSVVRAAEGEFVIREIPAERPSNVIPLRDRS